MGPNGSGKSTLASVIMGHPKYKITGGKLLLDGQDITTLPPDERSRRGLFLAFQYPSEIPGISLSNFLRLAYNARRPKAEQLGVLPFQKKLKATLIDLKMDPAFLQRGVNEGFSGGEKKKVEMIQLALLQPTIAILDETDSGLDIDALKTVAESVRAFAGPERGILIITHYQRILDYIEPQFVHVLAGGRIIRSGDRSLVDELEANGYEQIVAEQS
jgi:Fe-S cluster assembly ATP-binding protein